ncbi:hypothetical protein [uncultured Sunxiuqinia sp.]|uniref:hypothetical protein n=1 Tax=uncultured Sunxiuqinia sp. TaxID=1573825 RepID=UPI002611CE7D|nr:hypothetical protein [uncultured Sunxiuqinia sp.]
MIYFFDGGPYKSKEVIPNWFRNLCQLRKDALFSQVLKQVQDDSVCDLTQFRN